LEILTMLKFLKDRMFCVVYKFGGSKRKKGDPIFKLQIKKMQTRPKSRGIKI